MKPKSKPRRCVCGKSSTFPLCDFSHQSEKWQCQPESGQVAKWCFVAGPQNYNLSEKLAAQFGGVAAHTIEESLVVENQVLVTEGTDLETLSVLAKRISANQTLVMAVNANAQIIANLFPNALVAEISGDSLEVWQRIKKACLEFQDSNVVPTQQRSPKRLFVSHTVADEPFIVPAVEYVRRHFNSEVFLCADSIASGTDWQSKIIEQLKATEVFVYILSANSLSSTFCAFEIGFASAAEKDLAIISIDGTSPPAFAQHIQMGDVERLRLRNPWLDPDEAFLELMLELL